VSTQVTAIAANQPTPWMGLVERVSVYAPMLWLAVFSVLLLRRKHPGMPAQLPARAPPTIA
jgi:hypothetical protein